MDDVSSHRLNEAPRPKGCGFPVRYFPFILCPFLPAGRQGPRPQGRDLRSTCRSTLTCFQSVTITSPLGCFLSLSGCLIQRQKSPSSLTGSYFNLGNDLLSHTVTHAVPSARKGLTAVFGMGTGVSPSPWSPRI